MPQRASAIVHLIGPGGAGKSTLGPHLAERLGWRFVDLDQCFMGCHGGVAGFIAQQGYAAYARANVQSYLRALRQLAGQPAVLAVSSGFMLYPDDVVRGYPALRAGIEHHFATVLLLPAFSTEADSERCSALIVGRQLARPYLRGDRAAETQRIAARLPRFLALRCARFDSNRPPEILAQAVAAHLGCASEGKFAPGARRVPPAGRTGS